MDLQTENYGAGGDVMNASDETVGGVHWSFWVIGAVTLIYNAAGTLIARKLLTDDGSDYSEARMVTGA